MIIGFDGSRAFIKKRTGTEEYSYQLLKHLAGIDRVNKYLVYLRPDSIVSPSKWPANFEFKVINYQRLWTQVGLSLQTFKDFLDVLFVPAHTLPVIRNPRLKTVVTVHDLGSEYLPSMHQIKQRLYLGFMQKYQLKTATSIISVSKATKEDLITKIGIDEKKIKVIHEGFDSKLFKTIKGDTLVNSLRQFKLKPQEYFLFVGTVQPRKNLIRVIEAFSRVILNKAKRSEGSLANASHIRDRSFGPSPQDDKINLVIVGSKGWMSDEIYRLPKQLGIEEKVKFLGYVADEKLPALYSGAQAFIFPSLFEGFGLPLLEAQSCGCPVITSNLSSMPEVVGKAILVDPYSVDDIVKGMERLQDPGNRQQLIKKGFENIKRFSWDKCAEETLKVLLSS